MTGRVPATAEVARRPGLREGQEGACRNRRRGAQGWAVRLAGSRPGFGGSVAARPALAGAGTGPAAGAAQACGVRSDCMAGDRRSGWRGVMSR